jgi:hypothetical protein
MGALLHQCCTNSLRQRQCYYGGSNSGCVVPIVAPPLNASLPSTADAKSRKLATESAVLLLSDVTDRRPLSTLASMRPALVVTAPSVAPAALEINRGDEGRGSVPASWTPLNGAPPSLPRR